MSSESLNRFIIAVHLRSQIGAMEMTYVSAIILPEATSLEDFAGGLHLSLNIAKANSDQSNDPETILMSLRMEIIPVIETSERCSITTLIQRKPKSGWHNWNLNLQPVAQQQPLRLLGKEFPWRTSFAKMIENFQYFSKNWLSSICEKPEQRLKRQDCSRLTTHSYLS
jgi:hypothetical protein